LPQPEVPPGMRMHVSIRPSGIAVNVSFLAYMPIGDAEATKLEHELLTAVSGVLSSQWHSSSQRLSDVVNTLPTVQAIETEQQ